MPGGCCTAGSAPYTASLPPDRPLKLQFNTRVRPAFEPGYALSLDWLPRLEKNAADPLVWRDRLLPALNEVVSAVRKEGGGRKVAAGGLASIPAAIALGAAFLAPGGQKIMWNQSTSGRPDQLWDLDAKREATGFQWQSTDDNVSATDLAVLVSVTDNVERAFAQTKATLPKFGAITRVAASRGPGRVDVATAGQAVDIALTVIEAIREARHKYAPVSTIHLFMAVPLGVAMLIGQNLNTFGPIQTYEHERTDSIGTYRASASLTT